MCIRDSICLEDTHNSCGGVSLPHEHIQAIAQLATARGIPLHLDGARFFNAVVAKGAEPREMAAPFETVSICLSKGLGAPVGSILVGSKTSIARAYRFRKMYGGGMRQAGVIAAAGLFALEQHVERLADDHHRAKVLADYLRTLPGFRVDMDRVQTNLVYFGLEEGHPLSTLQPDGKPALVHKLADQGVAITGGPYRLRAALHLDVDDSRLQRAMDAFRHAASHA